MYGLLTGSDQPAQGCLPIQFRFGSHPAKSDWGLLSFPINNPATHIVSPFLRTKKSLFCLTQTKETLFFQPMPQPGFSFSHHREQEVSPPLFIQQKTLYPTKVFLPSLLLSMSSRQARAVSLRVCNAPCTMQALLSKACCVPTVVLSGSLRSNRVLTGTAAPQPTLPGLPGLPGLDRCCRGCWRPPGPSGTCLLPFCIVQLSWPSPCVLGTTANLQRFSLYSRPVTFRSARAGPLKDFTDRHAQSTPCAARKRIYSYSLTRHRGYIRPTFDLISGNLPIHSPLIGRHMVVRRLLRLLIYEEKLLGIFLCRDCISTVQVFCSMLNECWIQQRTHVGREVQNGARSALGAARLPRFSLYSSVTIKGRLMGSRIALTMQVSPSHHVLEKDSISSTIRHKIA